MKGENAEVDDRVASFIITQAGYDRFLALEKWFTSNPILASVPAHVAASKWLWMETEDCVLKEAV